MRALQIGLLLGLLILPPPVGAGSLDEISHRDKLYTLAAHEKTIMAVGYPGLILRSTDGGASWQTQKIDSQDALFAIDLNAKGQGIIVGRSGLVFTSKDSGASWTKVDSKTKSHLFAVDLTDSGRAIAVGHFGTILSSEDAGATWQERSYDSNLPVVEGQEDASTTLSANEEENEGAVEEARLNVVRMLDDQKGWIAGEFGLILHTEDGGQTWKRQRAAEGKLLFDLRIISAQRVLAAGVEGSLMETTDGGTSWSLIKTGSTQHILGLWVQGEQLFLVGRDGLVMVRRTASGKFEKLESGLFTWLNRALFTDDKSGFVVGGRGFLLRTADGGSTWQRLSGR